MTDAVLALDLGTTGNRAIIYGKDWSILSSSYAEFDQIFPKPGWVEHNASQIWETAVTVMKEAISSLPSSTIISAMGITNQRETVIVWDKTSGTPLYNAIVWQCRRTTFKCHEMSPHKETIRSKTGLPLDPYFSATKIQWLLENVPNIEMFLDQDRLCFGTVDSWILWKLTNGAVHATDESNASRTMLVNLETGRYDPDLLTLFNIPEKILPKIKASDAMFGHTDEKQIGLRIPITAVLGDQQAALFAQCGEDVSAIKNTYGTGLFIVKPTLSRVFSDTLVSTIAWNRSGHRGYALEGSVFIGGSVIQWIRDQCGWMTDASESESLAESVSSSDGLYFVPSFTGLGAPHWTPETRGTLFGLTRGSTPAHITRAALESLAYQSADVIEIIKTLFPDQPIKCLYVDGGACQNNFLMQFQSDMLGLNIQRPADIESTAKGIAGLAAISANLCTEEEFRSQTSIEATFSPKMPHEERKIHMDGWKKAVRHTIRYYSDDTL